MRPASNQHPRRLPRAENPGGRSDIGSEVILPRKLRDAAIGMRAEGVRRRRTLIGNASSWQKPSFPKINKDGIFGTHTGGQRRGRGGCHDRGVLQCQLPSISADKPTSAYAYPVGSKN